MDEASWLLFFTLILEIAQPRSSKECGSFGIGRLLEGCLIRLQKVRYSTPVVVVEAPMHAPDSEEVIIRDSAPVIVQLFFRRSSVQKQMLAIGVSHCCIAALRYG